MNPKMILVLIGILVIIIVSYLLADFQNLGGRGTQTPTLTNTATPTNTPTATTTASRTPTMTASQTLTYTPTFTPTSTATNTLAPLWTVTKKPKENDGGNSSGGTCWDGNPPDPIWGCPPPGRTGT
jgi:hypothetical protein